MNNRESEDWLQTQPKRLTASGAMKIRLAITSVFFALLLFGAGATDASPISLGNAAQFAALSLDGLLQNASGTITGPAGVASSGFSWTGNSSFTSALYVNTGSTITLNGATPSSINQNAATNAFLSQAITDARNASAQASAATPTQTFPTNPGTITQTAVGNYVYNIGTMLNNQVLTVSAPAGSTVIVNLDTIAAILPDSALTLNIAGGLTANNVIWNISKATFLNQAGNKQVTGILLAPLATVAISGGATVTGQVIAMAVTTNGGGTIIFSGPVVPEPSTLSLVAIGAAALLGHRFLRRRKSPG
jgi:hypothetical protein